MKLFTAIATAAIAATGVIGQPAQATNQKLVSSSNTLCRSIVELNEVTGESVAPGTTTGAYLSKKTYSGFSYATLWSLAKKIGTSSDCRRMY